MAEHCARWEDEQGVPLSVATMSRVIRRLGITVKKVPRASERDEEARATWWAETAQLNPTRLIFVDESGTNLSLTRRYGRAPRGERVVAIVPRNHGPNITLLAAMSADGITAAMTMTGATDRQVWALFVRQILVPSLRPGQIVLWDNLAIYKNQALRQLIEAHGCQVRLLPRYSPDFKRKTALRQAGARTRPALEEAIAAGLDTITAHDAAAWFRHCGYARSEQLFYENRSSSCSPASR
jgi:hypothetical protein